LEGAFILYRVPRYDIKGKEILKTQEKFYASDISIIYATMGYHDFGVNTVSGNKNISKTKTESIYLSPSLLKNIKNEERIQIP
jgi:hypothetical protein